MSLNYVNSQRTDLSVAQRVNLVLTIYLQIMGMVLVRATVEFLARKSYLHPDGRASSVNIDLAFFFKLIFHPMDVQDETFIILFFFQRMRPLCC